MDTPEPLTGVGVAFCGGGFKTYAQVAALEALESESIPVAACAGTSAGSIIATLTAAGLDAATVTDILIKADQRIADSALLRNMKYRIFGLMTSAGLIPWEEMYEQATITLEDAQIKDFNDIKMPLGIPAVDLQDGQLVIFTNRPDIFRDSQNRWRCMSGDLDLAACITASSAYPLAISPAQYLDHYYIDGGVRMNLPTPLFNRSFVKKVVGIDMMRPLPPLAPSDFGTLSIVNRAISAAGEQLDLIHADIADLYINLPISGASTFDYGMGENVIKEARILLSSNPPDWSRVKPKLEPKTLWNKVKSWLSE